MKIEADRVSWRPRRMWLDSLVIRLVYVVRPVSRRLAIWLIARYAERQEDVTLWNDGRRIVGPDVESADWHLL